MTDFNLNDRAGEGDGNWQDVFEPVTGDAGRHTRVAKPTSAPDNEASPVTPTPTRAEVKSPAPSADLGTLNVSDTLTPLDRELAGLRELQPRSLGLVRALLLLVGTFLPIVRLPFVGSLTYFNNGRGDGVIVFGLAIASLILVATRRFRLLWLTGLASLGLMGYTLLSFISVMQDTRRSFAEDDMFGIGAMMIQSVQLEWGWIVMLAGAGLVLYTAYKSARD